MLPSVTTHSSFIYQVCSDVGRCVKSVYSRSGVWLGYTTCASLSPQWQMRNYQQFRANSKHVSSPKKTYQDATFPATSDETKY